MTFEERAAMFELIARIHRAKYTQWMAAKAFVICWPLLFSACTTTHAPADHQPDRSETQLSRNVFAVRVRETAHASDSKATEVCLLRCAEVTLTHGFKRFVVLESADKRVAKALEGRISRQTGSRDGALSRIDYGAGSQASATTIACFRDQAMGFPEAYDAEAVMSQLSGRYGNKEALKASANPLDVSPLQFRLYPSFLFLSKTTPDEIIFLEPDAARQTIAIGFLNDWENPCATLDEFKRKAAIAAAILGGQGVQIQKKNGGSQVGSSSDFAAAVLLIPKARLGLEDEGGKWPRTELVVQGFDKESLAPEAGLKVGDRIVALNGIDVLQEKRFADAWLSWTVGESVVVTFIRDGVKMSLQAKTIAN